MPYDVGRTLKKCRNNANITVKEISELLTERGFKASESTIYSWENGNSQPTPGALLTMCEVYKVDDILTTFGYNGYNEDGSLSLSMSEIDMVEKYRALDPHGREMVDFTLEKEYERSKKLFLNEDTDISYDCTSMPVTKVAESISEYGINAAHERTDTNVNNDMKKYDENIMDDDDF